MVKIEELEKEKNGAISKIKDFEIMYSSGNLLDEEYEELRKPLDEKVKKLDKELKRLSSKKSEDVAPIRPSIEIDGKRTLDKDVEKVIPKDRTKNVIRLIFNLIICGFFIVIFSGFIPFMIIIGLITLIVLVSGLENTSETLIISSKGLIYSTIWDEIDSDWKDLLKIEEVKHKQRSEQTGLIVSSTMEYIFQTSNGTFTLKEDNAWGRDAVTLREVYDKIISRVPGAKIIQREDESILHDTGGK